MKRLLTVTIIYRIVTGVPRAEVLPAAHRRNVTIILAKEFRMNDDILQGNWKKLKGRLREEWGELTNDDVDRIQGNRQQLEGALQERYGYAKDEARDEVDDWLDRMSDDDDF